MAYVDVETLLTAWLPTVVTPAPRVGVATPADPDGTYVWVQAGFVRVHRVGGGGRFGIDRPRVTVDCFHTTYPAAATLAAAVRGALETQLIGYGTPAGSVLDVSTDSGPSWAPYDDVRVFRFVGTYSLVTHAA